MRDATPLTRSGLVIQEWLQSKPPIKFIHFVHDFGTYAFDLRVAICDFDETLIAQLELASSTIRDKPSLTNFGRRRKAMLRTQEQRRKQRSGVFLHHIQKFLIPFDGILRHRKEPVNIDVGVVLKEVLNAVFVGVQLGLEHLGRVLT